VNDLAGPVALALVGLWVAYLVPHKLRLRQQLLESRADDRFSEALRVVAVTDRRSRTRQVSVGASAECGPMVSSTAGLLTPGKGLPMLSIGAATGGTTVDRPHGTQDRITADAARRAAQARAARAAAVARRAAAARRRAVLAGLLVAATVAGWAVVGLVPTVGWAAGVVPSVLLTSVLVLGRRAVLAGREADEAWAAKLADERRTAGAPRTGAQRAVATAAATARAAASTAPSASTSASRPAATASTSASRPAAKASTSASHRSATASPSTPATAAESSTASGAAHTSPHSVTGRAIHPSNDSTEVFARIVEDTGESGGPVRHATGQIPVVRRSASLTTGAIPTGTAPTPADAAPDAPRSTETETDAAATEEWSPIRVPRPTYTMKPTAPRREPAPLENLEGSTAARTYTVADATFDSSADAERTPLEPPVETTGSIDLNAVLAKRRAAGE